MRVMRYPPLENRLRSVRRVAGPYGEALRSRRARAVYFTTTLRAILPRLARDSSSVASPMTATRYRASSEGWPSGRC